MMLLVWLPSAQKQRREAIEHIAKENPAAALYQLDEIEKQTDTLLQHPVIGKKIPGLGYAVSSRPWRSKLSPCLC